MSGRRAALIDRFRSRARERIAAIVDALRGGSPIDAETWNEQLGGVHTIKGEARMLGFTELAAAVHALEDALHAHRPGDRSEATIALAEAVAAQLDEGGARARSMPSETPADAKAEAKAERTSARVLVQSNRLDVGLPQVDALCEGLESLRASLARHRALGAADATSLAELLAHAERLADEAWELRIGSAEPMLTALARHAEELAHKQGKRLRAEVDAEGTALDRPVLDALAEPLLHLVRNAVDHGLELPGDRGDKPAVCTLALEAIARGREVSIIVRDDGRGIDADRVRAAALDKGWIDAAGAASMSDEEVLDLVFRPGFSTRERANDLSGRGVGLDVVRRVAESLGGGVSLTSERSRGTRFVVSVPVGLTRERVLVLDVDGTLFGISGRVVRSVEPLDDRLELGPTGAMLRLPDGRLPVRSFADLVGFARGDEERIALVVDIAERRWAVAVTRILGERDLLRRPADAALAALGVASASAVLDDGRPVLLPTLAELLRRRGARGAMVTRERAAPATRLERRALVVDDSPIIRDLVSELLTAASFRVTAAADGAAALEALLRQEFDVVVSDLEMPEVDGLELLRRMRARGVGTPFVMVTTRGSAEDRRRAAELGAAGYVVKTDFHEGHLVEVVNRAAGGSA